MSWCAHSHGNSFNLFSATMTSHSMELAYLPTTALMTPQIMDIVRSNPNLAMDFNKSSLSKPTSMTSPPMNHI